MLTGTNQTKKRPPVLVSTPPLPRFGGSRGISSIIGTIFFVIVVFFICANVFLWTFAQNARYNQAVKDSLQMDQDRFSERIAIYGAHSVAGGKVRVDATLTNEGPLPVRIITLWVEDETINSHGFKSGLDIGLNPGDRRFISEEVAVPGAEADHKFKIWCVTARGNLVYFKKEQFVTVSNMTSVMGPVLPEYQSLRWFSEAANGTWQIPRKEKVIGWSLILTNFYHEVITLSTISAFKVEWGAQAYYWYLKEDYTLPVGEEVRITFQAKKPEEGVELSNPGIYPTVVTLVGKYVSGRPYGQMFSFVAIEVVE